MTYSQHKKTSPKILASAATGILDTLKHCGADIGSIFELSEIDSEKMLNPNYELELKNFCNLFEASAEITNNSYFGLTFGADFKPVNLGAIGYLSVNSPTLSAALKTLINYFPAHQDNGALSLSRHDNIYQLSYEITDQRIHNRRQDAELSIAIFCNLFRQCLGDKWVPLEVHFEHNKIDQNTSLYDKIFGCPTLFNQNANAILFADRDMTAVMPNSDPILFAILEPQLLQRKENKSSPEDLAVEIRHFLKLNFNTEPPTIEHAAKHLKMSTYELQKKLKEQGVLFNTLIRATRQELAIKRLSESDLNLTEIALSLGYSELSAFSRAFKAWTNMTPYQYRKTASEKN